MNKEKVMFFFFTYIVQMKYENNLLHVRKTLLNRKKYFTIQETREHRNTQVKKKKKKKNQKHINVT